MEPLKVLYSTLVVILCLNSEWLSAETLDTKISTLDGKKFSFPADIEGKPLSLIFLAMADNRNDGESQQKILIDWHLALKDADVFTEGMSVYYFSVVNKAPFFVRKFISNAIADIYKGLVLPSKSAVIFAKNLDVFTSVSQSKVNKGPALILLSLENEVLLELIGSPDENKINLLQANIEAYMERRERPR